MKKWLSMLLALALFVTPVFAEEGEETEGEEAAYTEIYTVEELLRLPENPEGSYRLMADLDMTDVSWPCPGFSGIFDGNGHSLLNLSITEPGEDRGEVLDGNQKKYDAVFAGFFSTLNRAEVKDLSLINLNILVETDEPCMVGGLAGYAMDSSVTGCTVEGRLELRAHQGMFGLAGILGYGVGQVDHCTSDVTLICVDTDAETTDEQFLGGVFGTGFVSVQNSEVYIDAYISEHGFVHSGGVGGMLLQYPIGMGRESLLQDNWVGGKITFFEDSPSRRAYCKAIVGELLKTMNFNYYIKNNTIDDFQSEETRDFDAELRPETCEDPEYSEEVVPSGCKEFGYTQYTCKSCGYSYRDHYTLHSHTVTSWQVVKPATTAEEGESEGVCDNCGVLVTRVDPVLPEPTEPETTEPETTEPTTTTTQPPETTQPEKTPASAAPEEVHKEKNGLPTWVKWVWGLVTAVVIGGVVFVLTEPKGKHLRKK